MKPSFEIIKTVLPPIIAAMTAFLVAKYNYSKNRPLDKLEIAYNHMYYPIYRIVRELNQDECIAKIDKIEKYINTHKKYCDRSTIVAFNYFKECVSQQNNRKIKKSYKNFRDNIFSRNSYIRRQLGYLEPNILNVYTYSTPSEKRTFRILFEFVAIYISVFLINIKITQHIGVIIILLAILFLIIDGASTIIYSITTNITKIIEERKDRRVGTK